MLLGKSEMLITHADLFAPVDMKRRLFHRVHHPARRPRERVVAANPAGSASQSMSDSLREAAFDVGNPAQAVFDSGGALVMVNDGARRMFGLGPKDFGRPIQDLELSYRPVELRGHLDIVASELRSVEVKGIRWLSNGDARILDVRISPLLNDGTAMGTVVTYADVTEVQRLHDALITSRKALEEASDELQSTVEELETTNEELQSTNEELETTNEELQSTNEELETMNEELQSANEELETINEELRHRTLELNNTNLFLETILSTIGVAVAVLDRHQRVQVWNSQAYELWGLTAEEVEDQNLLALDFGLPIEQLKAQLRGCLNGDSTRREIVLEATNRRGKQFECRITCMPMGNDHNGEVSGLIMLMEAV
jgi:two-component system CheB/CheR fusion protein